MNPFPPELFLLPALAAAPPQPLLLPHPLHLPRHRATSTAAASGATSARSPTSSADELYGRPVGAHRLRRAPPRHRADRSPRAPGPAARGSPTTRCARLRADRARGAAPARARRTCLGADPSTSSGRAATRASRPVNGLLNCLALFAHDPRIPSSTPSLAGVEAWRWEDEARASATRRALERLGHRVRAAARSLEAPADGARPRGRRSRRAYAFLATRRSRRSCPTAGGRERDPILGGWCFSDGAHRWPVSDCTAEALIAILRIHARAGARPPAERIPTSASRRPSRSSSPARTPTAASAPTSGAAAAAPRGAQPVGDVRQLHDRALLPRVHRLVRRRAGRAPRGASRRCLDASRSTRAIDARRPRSCERAQRADGSWPGFWGVNFTYAHLPRRRGAARRRRRRRTIRRSRARPSGSSRTERRRRLGRALRRAASTTATSSTPRARRS